MWKVGELSVVLDSGFFVNAEEYLSPLLAYMRDEPSAAYNSHCTEVRGFGALLSPYLKHVIREPHTTHGTVEVLHRVLLGFFNGGVLDLTRKIIFMGKVTVPRPIHKHKHSKKI